MSSNSKSTTTNSTAHKKRPASAPTANQPVAKRAHTQVSDWWDNLTATNQAACQTRLIDVRKTTQGNMDAAYESVTKGTMVWKCSMEEFTELWNNEKRVQCAKIMHDFLAEGRKAFASAIPNQTAKAAEAAAKEPTFRTVGAIKHVPWSMFANSVPISEGGFMQRNLLDTPDPVLLQSLITKGYDSTGSQLAVVEVPLGTEELKVLVAAGLYPADFDPPTTALSAQWEEGQHKQGGMDCC
jgi:hypothetical protein